MAKVNLSPETVREMLSIIREARNDMKKLYDTASMVSSALSKPQEMNLKKKTENPLSQDGDESVSLKQISTVGKVVDGRNHQLLARNASVGREMSRNFEDPLSNFVEHMVGQKRHEVSMVENSKMERYSDGFGRQAPLSTSSVTSPLPKKPPDPPDTIHRKSRNKGHCQLKHKGSQILVMECDDEEKVEGLEDSVSVALDQKEKQAIDQEYEHAKAKLEDCPIPNEYQDDPVTLIKSSNDIKLSFSHGSSDSNISILSSVEMVQCISGGDGNEEKHCVCLSQVERIWEPGGLPAKAIQFYWPGIRQQLYQPEICQSLWFSAVVTDTRLKRQLLIQLKELLFGSSEFSAKIHKPPDQNKKCEAELEIQMHHSSKTQKLCVMYHCSKMEFSGFKKLHELSLQKKLGLVSPLVKETQDWIVNAWFKTQACSGFEKKSSDMNSLMNVLEPSMPSSRLLVVGLKQFIFAGLKFHLKHKWRSRLLEAFAGVTTTIQMDNWKIEKVAYVSWTLNSIMVAEKKKTRSHGGLDYTEDVTARTSAAGFISSCKLVVSTLNPVVEHKTLPVRVLCRKTMAYGYALDEIHELMVKQSLPQVQMLVYSFDISCSKAVTTMVVYGINSTAVGDKNKNVSGMSMGWGIHCCCRRHVQAYEDKTLSFPSNILSSAILESNTHENGLLVMSQTMQRSRESGFCVCLIGVIAVKDEMDRRYILGHSLASVLTYECYHFPRPPELLFHSMDCWSSYLSLILEGKDVLKKGVL